jgi:hypothetical protein
LKCARLHVVPAGVANFFDFFLKDPFDSSIPDQLKHAWLHVVPVGAMKDFVEQVGPSKVAAVVTDSARSALESCRLLHDLFPHIIMLRCRTSSKLLALLFLIAEYRLPNMDSMSYSACQAGPSVYPIGFSDGLRLAGAWCAPLRWSWAAS